MSSLELKPTICFFYKVPPLHLKRSLLLWHCCLSAWCTWSFVTSETHNSKTDHTWRCLTTQPLKLLEESSKMNTHRVHFVVFVFSIDVFDIWYNVGVQRLWRRRLLFRMATMEPTRLNTQSNVTNVSYFSPHAFTFLRSLSWHLRSSKKSSRSLVGSMRSLFLRRMRALQKVCQGEEAFL